MAFFADAQPALALRWVWAHVQAIGWIRDTELVWEASTAHREALQRVESIVEARETMRELERERERLRLLEAQRDEERKERERQEERARREEVRGCATWRW